MTKVMFKGLLASLVVALLAAWSARAAEPKPSQPYVVLVGISNYADKQIKPRPQAETDVKALYDLFTDKDHLGVDADHVRLLLGSKDDKRKSEPATHDNILKALHWLATNAKLDDLALFVFIGQGGSLGELGDRTCYFASDSTLKERTKTAVAAAEIAQELDKLKSQRFCAFIDVNFKGYDPGKDPIPEARLDNNNPYKEFLGSDGSEEHAPAAGRVVFLATSGLTQSLDLEKNGLFTKVLVDALKGAADKEGYEPDGLITVDELEVYFRKEMRNLATEHGKTREQKEQFSPVLGAANNHFALTRNPAATAKVQERLTKLEQLAKDKKVSPALAEEGQSLLSRMPKLESQRNLRKAYQQLVDGGLTLEKFEEKRNSILEDRKLKLSAATDYAAKVMKVIRTIRNEYVKETNDGELVAWAIRGLYQRVDEKVPPEVAGRLTGAKDQKEEELLGLLKDARLYLGKREDLDNGKDLDISLQRMLSHLDPYTTYFDAEMKKNLEKDTRGRFTGIGIQISKDGATDMLRVVTPIKGSPAYKAGLKAGDIVTKIVREVDSQGKPLDPVEVIPTKGLPLQEAVNKILGQPRTKVKLTIEREGETKPLEFEITRGRVEVESVLGIKRKTDDEWDYYVDPENKIAYVRLTGFADNTYRDLKDAMTKMEKQGLKGFVLDLRFNPGGLLDSAWRISDLYIDDGLIVTVRPRTGRAIPFTGQHEGSLLNFPMVCLVNGMSASGSEIVAACLQDHKRAVIMGERSYGKGSVQNIQPYEGGELKLTTATFWRPSDKNLNKSSTSGKDDDEWGVMPDKGHEVKLSRKERDDLFDHQHFLEIIQRADKPQKHPNPDFKDRQLEKAVDYLREQIKTASKVPAKKAG